MNDANASKQRPELHVVSSDKSVKDIIEWALPNTVNSGDETRPLFLTMLVFVAE